jgi:6-phosphogluconolactonase
VSTPTFRVRRFATRAALQEALAGRLQSELEYPGERVAVMLSGGSTPVPAFRALGAQRLAPAAGLSILYSDERHVPADSEASNFFQSGPLLQALALRDEHVLRVRTELPLALAADDYERQLAALLRSAPSLRFGMIGLGADGHTASLFSTDDLQRAQGRLAIAVHRPDGRDAVSVTPTLLAKFESLLVVVAGADKRSIVERLLAHDGEVLAMRALAGRANVDVWGDAEALP